MVVPICGCHRFYITLKKQTNFFIYLNCKSATNANQAPNVQAIAGIREKLLI
jgi:hypothetical protein